MLETWTEARTERLKVLHASGMTCAEIAADLGGVSRNAVIGKLSRLGLTSTRKAKPPARLACQRDLARPPRSNAGPQVQAINARKHEPDIANEVPVAERQADVAPLHISLDDLTSTTCRWPYGDRAPFTFCGCSAPEGKAYCAPHHALSRSGITYGAPSQRFSEEHRRRLSEAQKARHARHRGVAA